MVRYCVVFQPRSGSTQFVSRLDIPEIGFHCGYELITLRSAKQLSLIAPSEVANWGPSLKKEVVLRYFDSVASKSTVAGFKVAAYQIWDDLPGFIQFLPTVADKLIFIYRQDSFATALSQCLSLITSGEGRLPAAVADATTADGRARDVLVDPSVFEYYYVDSVINAELIISLSRLFSRGLLIEYNSLPLEAGSSMRHVYDFFGLGKGCPQKDGLFRKGSGSSGYNVTNMDQLRVFSDYHDRVRAEQVTLNQKPPSLGMPSPYAEGVESAATPVKRGNEAEFDALLNRAFLAESYASSLEKRVRELELRLSRFTVAATEY
jgi:hypothetical protein